MQQAAERKAIIALLFDRFKITPEQYARLTDRQIFDLFLHARKEDGSIDTEPPVLPLAAEENEEEEKATFESELAKLELLANFSITQGGKTAPSPFVTKEQFAELKEQLRKKYEQ